MTTTDFDNPASDVPGGGFLSDIGLDEVDANPNHLPDAQYHGHLFDCKVVNYKDTTKGKAVVFTYKVADGPEAGKTIDEWKSANKFDDARKKAWLKQRMLSLGVPESRISQVNPDDLKGTPVIFTTKKNGDFYNITSVKLQDDGGSGGESPAASSTDASGLDNLL